MTEAEWLACVDTKPILEYLDEKGSNRKLCLFASWCCRTIWCHMKKSSRRSVEVAERFFEGRARETVLKAAIAKATAAFEETSENTIEHSITLAASLVPVSDVKEADSVAYAVAKVVAHQSVYPDDFIETTDETEATYAARVLSEQARQCRVLRCIIGNPFRPIALEPAILTWNDATVVPLAQAAYDERTLPEGTLDNARLAVLADALEEAGCTDADVLDNLRGPGPHVRGCWSVDLCLGKS
jgi:hypothetical protein